MSITASSLAFASQQLVIYAGLITFILGVIGGSLILIVFLSLRTFRQSSCAFYLTIMSVVNTLHLFTAVLTYIMINGFDINWTDTSLFYCKFRAFYVPISNSVSFTCMCLATIDQFLATCSHPRWHRWNNIRFARYMVLGTVIVWTLHGILGLIYFNRIQSPTTSKVTCAVTNSVFQKYAIFFHIFVLGTCLPIAIMILFGFCAYRNVQQIAYRAVPLIRRELDKQLTSMVLVQVLCDIVFITPLAVQIVCNFAIGTPNDLFTQMLLRLITNVEQIWFFLRYAESFYIYVCVSKRFRQQLVYVLSTIRQNGWCRQRINNNQIKPQG